MRTAKAYETRADSVTLCRFRSSGKPWTDSNRMLSEPTWPVLRGPLVFESVQVRTKKVWAIGQMGARVSDNDWLVPQTALEMLVIAGVGRPEAWHLLKGAMRQGRVRCQVSSILTRSVGTPDDQRFQVELPSATWLYGEVPSPGHLFWRSGDANLTVRLPGSMTLDQAMEDDLSFAPVAPEVEVRGTRLNRLDVDLLAYDSQTERTRAREKKRREPTGDLPSDEQIEAMMMKLIKSGLTRDEAAKQIKYQPGFEAVTNEHARRVVAHKLPRGRPKSKRTA